MKTGIFVHIEDLKNKLVNLERIMPGQNHYVYDFGKYLAQEWLTQNNMPPRYNGMGFSVESHLAVDRLALQRGVFPGTKVRSTLRSASPVIFEYLRREIPDIADAIGKECGDLSFGEKAREDTNRYMKREYVQNPATIGAYSLS